jgi:DNA-binding MarR family transcriptional regulator
MQSQQSENGDYLYTTFFSLISNARQIDSSAQNWFEDKGSNTNLNQWSIMHFLSTNKVASQLEIAEFICRDAATITRMLDKMTRDGLIERTQNLEDRRKWKVSLTTQGELKYQELKEKAASLISASFIGFQRSEIQVLVKLVDQISKNIKI